MIDGCAVLRERHAACLGGHQLDGRVPGRYLDRVPAMVSRVSAPRRLLAPLAGQRLVAVDQDSIPLPTKSVSGTGLPAEPWPNPKEPPHQKCSEDFSSS